jgi:hypothetical protein
MRDKAKSFWWHKMGDVVEFPITVLTVGKMLSLAESKDLADVVLIGRKKDGSYFVATSTDDPIYINWLIDKLKIELLADG